jgi:hypothetical protein
VETFTQLYKFFDRSWSRTREAVELAGEVSARSIEARFQRRSLGMPARYTEDVLRETVARAAEHFGYPPNTEEFTWWREREIECAQARGEQNPQIPALGPYYSRWDLGSGPPALRLHTRADRGPSATAGQELHQPG